VINIARKIYKFTATIIQNQNMDAGYIEVPFDVEKEFGKKRVLVEATFDGYKYLGQLVRMQTKCHIIGIRKDIRKAINKTFGDTIQVTIKERNKNND
jgi:citrate lyase gamma subunit